MGYPARHMHETATIDTATIETARPPSINTGPTAGPVVDPAVFDEILEMVGPRGRQTLLRHILEDLDAVATGIEAALDRGERDDVRRHGHTLSGLAGTLGARGLNEMVTALLQRVREGGRLPCSTEVALLPEITRLRAFCAGFVDRDRLA